jgi:hypothetical protein
MGSVNLREAAERLLAAWEETPPPNADKDPISRAMDMLRRALPHCAGLPPMGAVWVTG